MAPIALPLSPSPTPQPEQLKTATQVSVQVQPVVITPEGSPKSKSTELTQSESQAKSTSLFHHSTPRPIATSAQGLNFTLSDGRTILDGISGGAAVACLGQGNKEVLGAMMEQAEKMAYTYHQSVGCESSEKLAKILCDKGGFEAAAFLNSGSEAVESCIKLVKQYWVEKGEPERKYIIARFPSYHGNSMAALEVGNMPGRRTIYKSLFSGSFHHVDTPLYKRHSVAGESEEEYSSRLAFELEAKILELGPENCMAFFAEPVQGTAVGVMPPPKGYFPAIKAVLEKYDLLLVMDEVMTGAGRCGELFSHQAVGEGVKPDIMAMAKGLGAGYVTISAVLVGDKVAKVVREAGQWKSSQTYQNHPVNCAVGVKIMEIIERDDLLKNVTERGEQLVRELKEAFVNTPIVFDVRGKGLFVGVEFDTPATLSPRFTDRVKDKAFNNGLLIMGLSGTIDGKAGDAVIVGPAYTVTSEQITEIVRLLKKSVEECVAEL